jgi:hypothetical protein
MISYKEWRRLREMAGTGAIWPGGKEKGQVPAAAPTKKNPLPANKRDYNWWGAPETAGMTQGQAKAEMEKDTK